MFSSVSHRTASAYQRVSVETDVSHASPHHLVHLLFQALLRNIGAARLAINSGAVSSKGNYIIKAVRIIDEGLKPALNRKDGGDLAQNLHGMYGYCVLRLTEANLTNSEAALCDVLRVIEPLADGWKGIAAEVDKNENKS
jgi:flagellar protein FliS